MTILDDAAAFLGDVRQKNTARNIIYSRGAHSVPLKVTFAPQEFVEKVFNGGLGSFQTVGKTQTWDVIIDDRNELILDGSVTAPEEQDKIEVTIEGIKYIHEVAKLGGEPHYRYVGDDRQKLRVHTKLIREEPAA